LEQRRRKRQCLFQEERKTSVFDVIKTLGLTTRSMSSPHIRSQRRKQPTKSVQMGSSSRSLLQLRNVPYGDCSANT
jgi:hypothetical protein